MNGILAMSSELLERNLTKPDRQSAQIIQDCADHLLNLLNDVLEFSSIEAGELKLDHIKFSVPEQIEKVINIFSVSAKEKRITLQEFVTMDRSNRYGMHLICLPDLLFGEIGVLSNILFIR